MKHKIFKGGCQCEMKSPCGFYYKSSERDVKAHFRLHIKKCIICLNHNILTNVHSSIEYV